MSLNFGYHISDLYFHAEFVQALGTEAGDQWFLDLATKRNQPNSSHSSSCCDSSYQGRSRGATPCRTACVSPVVSAPQSPRRRQEPTICNDASECSDFSGKILSLLKCKNAVENDDKFGLLFTDAAHSVLSDLSP